MVRHQSNGTLGKINIVEEFPPLPEFLHVAGELSSLELRLHPSEYHGAMSGYLSAVMSPTFRHWCEVAKQLALEEGAAPDEDELMIPDERSVLAQLYSATVAQLGDGEFAFQLLLPDDEEPLSDRTGGLVAWCQGFLFGVTASGVSDFDGMSEDVNELMRDLVEFTKMDVDPERETEQDEAAFMEVSEYVRVGVLLFRTECHLRPPSSSPRVH